MCQGASVCPEHCRVEVDVYTYSRDVKGPNACMSEQDQGTWTLCAAFLQVMFNSTGPLAFDRLLIIHTWGGVRAVMSSDSLHMSVYVYQPLFSDNNEPSG